MDNTSLLPFPKSKKMWIPTEETRALLVQLPQGMSAIPNWDTLMSLLAARLAVLAKTDESPERAVELTIQTLDGAGLTDLYVDQAALEKGSVQEWENLLARQSMRALLSQQMGKDQFPLRPSKDPDLLEEAEDQTLEDWAGRVSNLAQAVR